MPWGTKGVSRSNLSLCTMTSLCEQKLSILLPLFMIVYILNHKQQENLGYLRVLISAGLFLLVGVNKFFEPPYPIELNTWEYNQISIWNIEKNTVVLMLILDFWSWIFLFLLNRSLLAVLCGHWCIVVLKMHFVTILDKYILRGTLD